MENLFLLSDHVTIGICLTGLIFQGERFLCEQCYQISAQSTAAKLASAGTAPSMTAQKTQG